MDFANAPITPSLIWTVGNGTSIPIIFRPSRNVGVTSSTISLRRSTDEWLASASGNEPTSPAVLLLPRDRRNLVHKDGCSITGTGFSLRRTVIGNVFSVVS